MKLTELLSNHKEIFRQKFIEALAKQNSLTVEQAKSQYMDFIEQYVDEKYEPVDKLVKKINEIEKPVFLNIRRDRMREDKCRLCEANEPNVQAIQKKYGDKIKIFEVIEDRFEGGALYHIIFHEETEEKKLPLTAIITKGELLKFWAGATVELSMYETYINKSLAQA